MSNAWFRMYHEFATDPKVQMLSETDQRRYIMLLCLKCCNDDVTLHETEVAFQLRISNEELTATKQRLIEKGLIDESLNPTAWDKRQFVSDSSASRVAKHRAKKKQQCNVTVTKSNAPDTDTDTDTDTEKRREKGKKPTRSKTTSAKTAFTKPRETEVIELGVQSNLNISGFFDYYESNGWMVGKNKMKDWKAAARSWHNRQSTFKKPQHNQARGKDECFSDKYWEAVENA